MSLGAKTHRAKLEHLSLQTRYVGGMPLPFEGSHLGPPSAKAKTSWSGHPTVAALRRATLVSEQNVVNLFSYISNSSIRLFITAVIVFFLSLSLSLGTAWCESIRPTWSGAKSARTRRSFASSDSFLSGETKGCQVPNWNQTYTICIL